MFWIIASSKVLFNFVVHFMLLIPFRSKQFWYCIGLIGTLGLFSDYIYNQQVCGVVMIAKQRSVIYLQTYVRTGRVFKYLPNNDNDNN